MCLLDECRLERDVGHVRSAAQEYRRVRRAGNARPFCITVRCADVGKIRCSVYAHDRVEEVMKHALGRLAFGSPGSDASRQALCAVREAKQVLRGIRRPSSGSSRSVWCTNRGSALQVADTLAANGVCPGATISIRLKVPGGVHGASPPGGEAQVTPIVEAHDGAGGEPETLPGQPELPAAAPAPVEPSPGSACLVVEDAATDEAVVRHSDDDVASGAAALLGLKYSEALGLTWAKIEGDHAHGRELNHPGLAAALAAKKEDDYTKRIELTQQEWDALGIRDLRLDQYISLESGGNFFAPLGFDDACDIDKTAKELKARGAKVDADGRLDLQEVDLVSGLEWHRAGAPPEKGIALEQPQLAEELARNKTVFGQGEWDALGISNLGSTHYVQCGDGTCFVPSAAKVDLRGLDLRGANLEGVNLAGALLDFCDLREAKMRGVVGSVGFESPTGDQKPTDLWMEWRRGKIGKIPAQAASLR